eukprot:m.1115910 g.1115910  ORF g.1115910 m.1115910 type:complete len:687 (-) comp24373_c0_seq1:124-2184(-)
MRRFGHCLRRGTRSRHIPVCPSVLHTARCVSGSAAVHGGNTGSERYKGLLFCGSAAVGGLAVFAYANEKNKPVQQQSKVPAVREEQGCSAQMVAAAKLPFKPFCRKGVCDRENCVPLPGDPRPDLPTISLKDVRLDRGEDVWVTLNGGVYDVTKFLDAHPGGANRIRMVNGLDLKQFWKVYDLHDRPHIRQLLEHYRIGNLSPKDAAQIESESAFTSPYGGDPARPAAYQGKLRIPSIHPWNSEPKLEHVMDEYFTPNDLFFVRNHNPVPEIDISDWELEIAPNEACGIRGGKFSLEDLKTKFKKYEVTSVVQCAGNRQEDYVTPGRPLYVAPHWRDGAIGCAKWAGVRVRDVLKATGLDVDGMALGTTDVPAAKIVNFIAEDTDETGNPYAGVLPIGKVIDPFGDAILAYEMNGETLPRDHGFPIRLLAPGHAGCRNVKWVSTIDVSEAPSELDAGSKLDRHFAPNYTFLEQIRHGDEHFSADSVAKSGTKQSIRLDQGPVIQTLPVQSIICFPQNKATLSGERDTIEVKGFAWSGGGRGICRVEVSIDGGKHFSAAELLEPPIQPQGFPAGSKPEYGQGSHWAWRQWVHTVVLPEDVKRAVKEGRVAELEICAKAVDGDFNSQPEDVDDTWNVLGVCVNHWPRSKVTLDPSIQLGGEPPAPAPPPPGSPWPEDVEAYERAQQAE